MHARREWVNNVFPQKTSSESPVSDGYISAVIVTGDNVLEPDIIKGMAVFHGDPEGFKY
jgi:hypothetical protein